MVLFRSLAQHSWNKYYETFFIIADFVIFEITLYFAGVEHLKKEMFSKWLSGQRDCRANESAPEGAVSEDNLQQAVNPP